MKLQRLRFLSGIDWSLYVVPIILSFLGVAVIFTISYSTNANLALDQVTYIILGLIGAITISFFDYRLLKGLYLILYFLGIGLLIAVLVFGSESFGATRWIDLGFTRLQPSELFKIIGIIVFSKFLADWQEIELKKFLLIIIMSFVPIVLILVQPDLGTASVVFVTTVVLLIASPVKKIYLVAGLVLMLVLSPVAWKFLKPYQKHRIEAFINPNSDPHGTGYNVNQAKIAVGSGGLIGRGLGKGSQSQLNFLPVAHTDFIFAGAAEAIGFIGSTFLLLLLTFLIIRTFTIAQLAKDYFGMYLATGIGSMFLFQMFVNAGMNIGIMPVTGIPLPFVSYGGTAMITNMLAIGILQSIYMRHKKISF